MEFKEAGVGIVPPPGIVARFAQVRSNHSVAAELKQSLRLLDRCQPDVNSSLRRALGIVQAHPLHDDEQREVEQHLEIALGFFGDPARGARTAA